jgi:hypothetical protein
VLKDHAAPARLGARSSCGLCPTPVVDRRRRVTEDS